MLFLQAALLAPLLFFAPQDAGGPWLGIEGEGIALPKAAESPGRAGIQVNKLLAGSPAAAAGLRSGDVIIALGGMGFGDDPAGALAVMHGNLARLKVGSTVVIRLLRRKNELRFNGVPVNRDALGWIRKTLPDLVGTLLLGSEIRLEITARFETLNLDCLLSKRPQDEGAAKRIPSNREILPTLARKNPLLARLAAWAEKRFGIEEAGADLRKRLARVAERGGEATPARLRYILREPFHSEAVLREILSHVEKGGVAALLGEQGAALLDLRVKARPLPSLKIGLKPAEHLDQLAALLEEAAGHHERAFAALSPAEREELDTHLDGIGERFRLHIYLYDDPDRERARRSWRLIELMRRVDRVELLAAARVLARVGDPLFLAGLVADLERAGANLESDVVLARDTPRGKILVAGRGRQWHREPDPAILLDLGGDDFYTHNAGAATGLARPLAVLVDLEGDDAYEATRDAVQGCGRLGVGLLFDLGGNDTYIAQAWAQGCAEVGVGLLLDAGGDDTYRAQALSQGAALWGLGALLDSAGSDRYEGPLTVQGLGLHGGLGLLRDAAGNDSYYAKGLIPTSYGDSGIFEGWSQGCGVGFRTQASGGTGLLIDLAGRDRYEAGNFCQGGGYYFGLGVLQDAGKEGDLYIGSRYAQGFSAHQAVGLFAEEGGDDVYTTRQAVAQGLAWDECVTLFVDRKGDDVYEGGGFSQGASAHNSVCIFLDERGRDRYLRASQARAGGNDYHGGTSFSLFLDLGGGEDAYPTANSNNRVRHAPEHGVFFDLPARSLKSLKVSRLERLVDEGTSK